MYVTRMPPHQILLAHKMMAAITGKSSDSVIQDSQSTGRDPRFISEDDVVGEGHSGLLNHARAELGRSSVGRQNSLDSDFSEINELDGLSTELLD